MPYKQIVFALLLLLFVIFSTQLISSARKSQAPANVAARASFTSLQAGDEREIGGVKMHWCPSGKFTMGSPPNEPERRPSEDQVEVTLTKGFWMAKFEATQGDWRRVMGALPGPLTLELPAGDEGWPLRSAFRLRFEPERRYDYIGFRVVVVKL